jgi:hypothetical protein
MCARHARRVSQVKPGRFDGRKSLSLFVVFLGSGATPGRPVRQTYFLRRLHWQGAAGTFSKPCTREFVRVGSLAAFDREREQCVRRVDRSARVQLTCRSNLGLAV